MIKKIVKQFKQGTAIYSIRRALKQISGLVSSNRHSVDSEKEAILLLLRQLKRWINTNSDNQVLLVTDQSTLSRKIEFYLCNHRIRYIKTAINSIDQLSNSDIETVACIAAGFFDPKQLTRLGKCLSQHPLLYDIPFEFSIIPRVCNEALLKYDNQKCSSYISPLLIDDIDYLKIYESSRQYFDLKCSIRDYMDICQLLKQIIDRNIDGDLAEFGSYKGHSGYLISQTLNKLSRNTDKLLYMFDMFDKFPTENVGIDAFWNQSHYVDYRDVKSKFIDVDNVVLVKGDFTDTFGATDIEKLCFVFIDCDTYRGTKFLLNKIYDDYLSDGGIIVLEDYGHGPLLGNRVAYHEYFDSRNDCFKFFSQFSGFQIIIKMETKT
jgi:hypothetical protein